MRCCVVIGCRLTTRLDAKLASACVAARKSPPTCATRPPSRRADAEVDWTRVACKRAESERSLARLQVSLTSRLSARKAPEEASDARASSSGDRLNLTLARAPQSRGNFTSQLGQLRRKLNHNREEFQFGCRAERRLAPICAFHSADSAPDSRVHSPESRTHLTGADATKSPVRSAGSTTSSLAHTQTNSAEAPFPATVSACGRSLDATRGHERRGSISVRRHRASRATLRRKRKRKPSRSRRRKRNQRRADPSSVASP